MRKSDWVCVGVLGILAFYIWNRDTSWVKQASEALPILAAIPLFVWLSGPWRFNDDEFQVNSNVLIIALCLIMVGVLSNVTLLLSVAWVILLWSWLSKRLVAEDLSRTKKLLVLPMMAFPWVFLDGDVLGWSFRLSAAWSVETFLQSIGVMVTREGTHMMVSNAPVSVDASCSGLKVLQAMLIAGSTIAYFQLGDTKYYWWSIPCLILTAWFANTLRVLALSVAALNFGSEFASGWFHTWGGWFLLMSMFSLCWVFFSFWKMMVSNQSNNQLSYSQA